MEKEIFNFNENRIKDEVNRNYGLVKKIKESFRYLEGKFHQNKVTKTLKNLVTYEGKNYVYYFIKDGDVTILVRQYDKHFTIYTYLRPKKSNEWSGQRFSVFTMFDSYEKMTNEDYTDDSLQTFRSVLPKIIQLVKEDEIDTVWNDHSFERPKYTEVKNIFTRDVVDNLDLLIFACDEITQKHLETFAENEMFEKIKTLKKGDPFGHVSVVHDTNVELKNEYFHGVGVWSTRTDEFGMKHEKEPEWNDVYALCRWHYLDVFPEIELEELIVKFYDDNWRTVFKPMTEQFFFDEIDFYKKLTDKLWEQHLENGKIFSTVKQTFKCDEKTFKKYLNRNITDKVKYLYTNYTKKDQQ